MHRAWRTSDFRAVFHLAIQVGLTPELIADGTGLPLDLVLNVLKGNTVLNGNARMVEAIAVGLGMPDDLRRIVGLSPQQIHPIAPLPKNRAAERRSPGNTVPAQGIINVRAEQRKLREKMRALDVSCREITAEMSRRYNLRPRTAWRTALGWSLEEAAEHYNARRAADNPKLAAALTGSRLSEWERWPQSGRKPTLASLCVLAEIYKCGVRDLIDLDDREKMSSSDLLALDKMSVPAAGPTEPSSREDAPRRRNASSAQNGLNPVDSPDLGRIDSLRQQLNRVFSQGVLAVASLDDWEHTAIRYARATRAGSASALVADLGQDLEELSGLLSRPLSVSASRRLTRVAAQMSGLMCLAFCILDDRPAFRRWARTARIAGSEAGDPEAYSWILAQEAHGHYYSGDMIEAIDVARNAYEVSRASCTGRALAAAIEARAHAVLGRNAEARSALARAEDTLSHLDGVLIPSAFGYNEASFRFHEGNAYTHLRDVKSAFRAQERALELCEPENYTDWAMTRLDRAQCLISADQITEGLEYAVETITSLAESKRRGIISLRMQEIIQTLPEKARRLTAARDFEELLMTTVRMSKADPR
jgi:transcriptional regulator with XRE-family HTH domain